MGEIDDVIRRADNERLAKLINADMDGRRPKWDDFQEIYEEDEIKKDQQQLAEYYEKKGINPNEKGELKDGILVEKMFLDTEMKDLFGEWDDDVQDELMNGDDGEDFVLYTIPAHEYDDVFNNADIICLVRNKLTNHQVVPFVVDCTSNSSKVREKSNYERTAENITGFTELKYFEDTASFSGVLPAGKLEKVPRFVVGFDAKLARELLTANYNDWTKDELDEKYDKVRYYLLKELAAQAKRGDTGLGDYFTFLLNNFENKHKNEIKIYPQDDVVEEVLRVNQDSE